MATGRTLRELAATRTRHDLVEAVREHLATYSPREIAGVPEECRPVRVRSIEDIYFSHQRLVETYCDRAARVAPSAAHQGLLAFFLAAAERASELFGTGVPAESPNDPFAQDEPLSSPDDSSGLKAKSRF